MSLVSLSHGVSGLNAPGHVEEEEGQEKGNVRLGMALFLWYALDLYEKLKTVKLIHVQVSTL